MECWALRAFPLKGQRGQRHKAKASVLTYSNKETRTVKQTGFSLPWKDYACLFLTQKAGGGCGLVAWWSSTVCRTRPHKRGPTYFAKELYCCIYCKSWLPRPLSWELSLTSNPILIKEVAGALQKRCTLQRILMQSCLKLYGDNCHKETVFQNRVLKCAKSKLLRVRFQKFCWTRFYSCLHGSFHRRPLCL